MDLSSIKKEDELRLVEKLLVEFANGDKKFFNSLSEHEKNAMLHVFRELRDKGESTLLDALWEMDYEEKPVPIETFLTDPFYLGKRLTESLYDKWKEAISYVVNNNKIEFIMSGAIGIGKSTAAIALMEYKFYELLCMRDPATFFDKTNLVFGFFSVSMDLAARVGHTILTTRLLESEYFRDAVGMEIEEFSKKNQREILDLPKKIKVVFGSRSQHVLGQDVISVFMDEVAFANSPGSKQITDLYTNAKRRIESRFLNEYGKLPGIMCLASSSNYEGDFLDSHMKEVMNDPSVHIVSYALYEVKHYHGDKFRVQVGDKFNASAVLDSYDGNNVVQSKEPSPTARIIEVPVFFYNSYVNDVESSLKDISGIALFTSSPLMTDRDKIYASVDPDKRHPFSLETININIHDSDLTLEEVFNLDELFILTDTFRKIRIPRYHPRSPRFVHIDLALKSDAAGIAMCHVAGVKEVTRVGNDGKNHKTVAPIIDFDFLLKCPPTKDSEIDLEKIRNFVYFLIDKGMPISRVTADSFQSRDTLQLFEKRGLTSKLISVDKNPEPYMALKTCIYEDRCRYYYYAPFLVELAALQRFDTKMPSGRYRTRIDHPPNGGKDVSDAAAGALYNLITSDVIEEQLSDPSLILSTTSINSNTSKINRADVQGSRWITSDYKDIDRLSGVIKDSTIY